MFIKPRHSFLATILAGIVFSVDVSSVMTSNPVELSDLVAAVQTQDLEPLLQTISSNGWKCPKFVSAWHLANVAPGPQLKILETQRGIGSDLAMRLEQWAPRFRNETAVELAKRTSQILDLAEWVGETEGYGNLLLAARCQDIACVGIGRLLVTPSFPVAVVETLVDRLDGAWREPLTRARVLNAEAGATLFVLAAIDTEGMERELLSTWRDGAIQWNLHQQPSLKQAIMASALARDSALREAIAASDARIAKSATMKAHLAFFHDDPIAAMPRPLTLARTWSAKRHEKLVIGLDTQNRYLITSLLAFRQRIGKLPDDRTGFEEAWTPIAPATQRKLYAPAWRAYEALKANQFLDEDSEAIRASVR